MTSTTICSSSAPAPAARARRASPPGTAPRSRSPRSSASAEPASSAAACRRRFWSTPAASPTPSPTRRLSAGRVGETQLRLADAGRRQGAGDHPPLRHLRRQSRTREGRDLAPARAGGRAERDRARRRRAASPPATSSSPPAARPELASARRGARTRDHLERDLRSRRVPAPAAGRRRRLYRGRVRLPVPPPRRGGPCVAARRQHPARLRRRHARRPARRDGARRRAVPLRPAAELHPRARARPSA